MRQITRIHRRELVVHEMVEDSMEDVGVYEGGSNPHLQNSWRSSSR